VEIPVVNNGSTDPQMSTHFVLGLIITYLSSSMKVTFSPILNPYFFLSLDGITICPFVLTLDVSMFYTVLLNELYSLSYPDIRQQFINPFCIQPAILLIYLCIAIFHTTSHYQLFRHGTYIFSSPLLSPTFLSPR
jgi:hypothetical protein